ncbi:MAG: hypothetical protein K2K37_01880 [Muribaculaceae bacterium]|nr:hypothetical protein [Muribaculaceae bacterium]
MENLFDSRRFGKYFTYQVRTGWKKYFTYIGSVLLVLLFVMLLNVLFGGDYEDTEYSMRYNSYGLDPMWGMEMGWFWFAIFAVCIFAGSYTFGGLADKNGRIFSLMMPASQLEKYLTRWIILGPFTLMVIVAGSELVDVIRYAVVSIRYPDTPNLHLLGGQLFDFTLTEWKILIASLLGMQSLALLGSSIWPKNAFVKTLFAIAIIAFVNSLWCGFLVKIFYEEGMYYGEGTIFDKKLIVPENIFLGAAIVIALVNYVVAYFRYREIEIVQRW